MTTPTRTNFDPLKPPDNATPIAQRTLSPDPTPNLSRQTSPISFKRRTPSKSVGTRASNLIGNLLSTSQERDVVPSTLDRPNAPSTINLPKSAYRVPSTSNFSQAVASDDEEDDFSEEEGLGGSNWRRRQTGGGQGRLSFAQGTAPARLVPPYTRAMGSPSKDPSMRSPGGGDRDDEVDPIPFVQTPLPKIPMIVL